MNSKRELIFGKHRFVFDRMHTAVMIETGKALLASDLKILKECFEIQFAELIMRTALNRILIVKRSQKGGPDELLSLSKRYLRKISGKEKVKIGIGKGICKEDELGLGLLSAELALENALKKKQKSAVLCYESIGMERLIESLSPESKEDFLQSLPARPSKNASDLKFQIYVEQKLGDMMKSRNER